MNNGAPMPDISKIAKMLGEMGAEEDGEEGAEVDEKKVQEA